MKITPIQDHMLFRRSLETVVIPEDLELEQEGENGIQSGGISELYGKYEKKSWRLKLNERFAKDGTKNL